MVYVSVGGVDCDFVTSFLKSDSGVNHKSLGTACPSQRVYDNFYLFPDQDEQMRYPSVLSRAHNARRICLVALSRGGLTRPSDDQS